MDQIHQGVTPGFEAVMAAFNPEGLVKNWQSRTVRLLRAQERITQGMMAAARAEMRFSQEFFASRMGLLRWDHTEPGSVSEQAQRDLENLVSVMREVSEELRSGFTEAAEIMRDEAQAAARESVEQASAVTARMQEEAQAGARETAAKAEAAIDKGREIGAQTQAAAKAAADDMVAQTSAAAQAATNAAADTAAEVTRKAARRSKGAADEAA